MSKNTDADKFEEIEIKFQSQVNEKEYKRVLLPPRFFVLPTFEKLTEIIKQAISYKKNQAQPATVEKKGKKQSIFKKD